MEDLDLMDQDLDLMDQNLDHMDQDLDQAQDQGLHLDQDQFYLLDQDLDHMEDLDHTDLDLDHMDQDLDHMGLDLDQDQFYPQDQDLEMMELYIIIFQHVHYMKKKEEELKVYKEQWDLLKKKHFHKVLIDHLLVEIMEDIQVNQNLEKVLWVLWKKEIWL